MSELKPCPFCGGKVDIQINSGSYGYTPPSVYIKCCDTLMSEDTEKWEQRKGHFSVYNEAVERLVDKWNTRYQPAPEVKG